MTNQTIKVKLKKVQYKTCIAITGAILGTSTKSLFDELGLMSLNKRRWYNKLTFVYQRANGFTRSFAILRRSSISR